MDILFALLFIFFLNPHIFCVLCRRDCGFFALQVELTYDGDSLLIFTQGDMLNIRMVTLYSWLTSSDFNIDLQELLGVNAGNSVFFFFLLFVALSSLYGHIYNSSVLLY